LAALIASVAVGLAGCSNSGTSPRAVVTRPVSQTACAFVVSYDDTAYIDVGTYPPVRFEIGERVGTATLPPCNDTGRESNEPTGTVAAYRVVGLDPSDAIAIRSGPGDGPMLLAARTEVGTSPAADAYIAERNPNGSVLVTPDRNLHDGDTVTVTIRGLDVGSVAMLAQCAPTQGSFACLTRSTGEIPPGSSPPSTPPAPANPGQARAPNTVVPGPNTVIRVTLQVHDPLRGDLELFDAEGNPVSHRKALDRVACHGAEALPCLIAVRGTRNGDQVVRFAQIRFDVAERPSTSTTD
jgi:hypothetical protein